MSMVMVGYTLWAVVWVCEVDIEIPHELGGAGTSVN